MRSSRPSLPVFVCGFARALSAGRRTCHAALARPLPLFDNYPRACGLHSDPVLTVDGGKCKGRRANKPGPHTLNTMMSCVSLFCLVYLTWHPIRSSLELLLFVVRTLNVDVSMKEWPGSDGKSSGPRRKDSRHIVSLAGELKEATWDGVFSHRTEVESNDVQIPHQCN